MPTLSREQVNALYDGIYGPSTGRNTPTQAQVDEMYRGIYGPANQSAPASPAMDAISDLYAGIYGPANYASEPGNMPAWSSLSEMFAPAGGKDQSRLVSPAYDYDPRMGSFALGYVSGIGAPLTTSVNNQGQRVVASNPQQVIGGAGSQSRVAPTPRPAGDAMIARSFAGLFGGNRPALPAAAPNIANSIAPTPRPYGDSLIARSFAAAPQATGLGALFTRPPLEITVQGANTIQPSRAPAPVPATPSTRVQQLRSMGLSAADAYAAANAGNKRTGHGALDRLGLNGSSGSGSNPGRAFDTSYDSLWD